MNAAITLGADVGIKQACEALNVSRATLYRHMKKNIATEETPAKRPASPLSLNEQEKLTVLDVLQSERFSDMAPHQVYAAELQCDIAWGLNPWSVIIYFFAP